MIISCWVITACRPTTANNGGRLVSSGVPQGCICSFFFSLFNFNRFGPSNGVCVVVVEGELSPCRNMNGGCGDLCLLTPQGRVNCTCRGERVLLDDNRCVCKSSANLQITVQYIRLNIDVNCNHRCCCIKLLLASYLIPFK